MLFYTINYLKVDTVTIIFFIHLMCKPLQCVLYNQWQRLDIYSPLP